jgi:hypothetical protein
VYFGVENGEWGDFGRTLQATKKKVMRRKKVSRMGAGGGSREQGVRGKKFGLRGEGFLTDRVGQRKIEDEPIERE